MADDFAADSSTSGIITIGGRASGEIETANDRDWFHIALEAGETYRLRLSGITLSDTVLYLYDAAGLLVAFNDDGGVGNDSLIVWPSLTAGTYYLEAAGFGSNIGTYALSAEYLDDYANNTSTTGVLSTAPFSVAEGVIERSSDQDWFRVSLTAGFSYGFRVTNSLFGNAIISLYDSAGNLLLTGDNGAAAPDLALPYVAPTGGTYYVGVARYAGATGGYSLDAGQADDFAAGTSTGGALSTAPFASSQGAIVRSNDQDWFGVALATGFSYGFRVTGALSGNAIISLYDSAGSLLQSGDNGAAAPDLDLPYVAAAGGTYYVGVAGYAGATGGYFLDAGQADDFAAGTSTSGALSTAPFASSQGAIVRSNDQDWFGVSLAAGFSYGFRVTGALSGNAIISLYDSAGSLLLSGDNGAAAPDLALPYVAPAGGTYYVGVAGYAGATGGYSLDAGQADDFAAATSTTGTLSTAPLAFSPGAIQRSNDHDWFRVSLTSGFGYRFRVFNSLSGNAIMSLYDSAGALLLSNDNGGAAPDLVLPYVATTSATFYLGVAGYAGATGLYSLSATGAPLPVIAIAPPSISRPEGNGGATQFQFTVNRTGDTALPSSIQWAVSGTVGAPAAGSDFAGGTFPTGALSFSSGETSKTISIAVNADLDIEANESFQVTLSGANQAVLGTPTAIGVIANDDAGSGILAIARQSATKPEGHGGTTAFSFLVSRSGDASGPAQAKWTVTGGGVGGTVAAAANDFAGGILPSGLVTFAALETAKAVTVSIAGDTSVELNESFTVTLSEPVSGVALGNATATGVILNDDARLSITTANAAKPEGSGATATPLTFTVTRSGDLSRAHSAAWTVAGAAGIGTVPATAADFAPGGFPSGQVVFAAGETTRSITVNVAADRQVELNERFSVNLSSPSAGATLGTATAGAVIFNDDAAGTGTVSIARQQASRAEGHAAPRISPSW